MVNYSMYPSNKIDYKVGELIGECTYLGDAYSKNWKRYATFKCKCGNKFIAYISKVRMLHTKSCGCVATKKIIAFNTTHGMANTVEYATWVRILQRCTNKNNPRYMEWGGRGIKVCERWANSFENFFEDMGKRPSKYHSLDRFPNNDGYYEPANCRWATPQEQAMNRSSNFIVEYKGQKEPLKKLTDLYGLSYSVVSQRIKKLGWSVQDAFEKPNRYSNA